MGFSEDLKAFLDRENPIPNDRDMVLNHKIRQGRVDAIREALPQLVRFLAEHGISVAAAPRGDGGATYCLSAEELVGIFDKFGGDIKRWGREAVGVPA